MSLELVEATIEQQPIIYNLLELYSYDFTEFGDFDIGDDGRYGYKYLPLYWIEPTRFPYLLYVDKKIAGFILVQKQLSAIDNEMVWDISEFFIMKKYRKRGVGTAAAFEIWKKLPGQWQVRVLDNNLIACAFWLRTIEKFTLKTLNKTGLLDKIGDCWFIYRFESKC